jgi:hypothetical protein
MVTAPTEPALTLSGAEACPIPRDRPFVGLERRA